MEMLKLPGPMGFKSVNAADAWDKRDRHFRNYFKAAELKKKDQVAILLELAGPDSLAISRTFTYKEATLARAGHPAQDAESPDDYETVLTKFAEYCRPCKKNTVYGRHRFWKRDQVNGESMDQWLIDLGSQTAICEFGAQEDLMIRDKLVYGVMDERAKERLLREGELTLQRAMDICRAAEST